MQRAVLAATLAVAVMASGCTAAAVVGVAAGGTATVGGVMVWPKDCGGEGCAYAKVAAVMLVAVGIPLLLLGGGYLIETDRDEQ